MALRRKSVFRVRPVLSIGLSAAAALISFVTAAPAAGAMPAVPADTGCPDVEVVFARGTGESAGLGSVGSPFAEALAGALPSRTVRSYAVDYSAQTWQVSAVEGALDMGERVVSIAASCQGTQFVIGGFSQGAMVTDLAIGVVQIAGVTAAVIPSSLAGRVAAIVVFGNPLGLLGRTIAQSSELYKMKVIEFCNTGDPVCGAGFDPAAHGKYVTDGSVVTGARFAAGRIR